MFYALLPTLHYTSTNVVSVLEKERDGERVKEALCGRRKVRTKSTPLESREPIVSVEELRRNVGSRLDLLHARTSLISANIFHTP